ncbi:hypothetical protein [Embleya sp. AB8]|uniref:hypothetical protein n=1 Tax=Embleya sp. AB8 TaxID=3156304 RepID=UPI003C72B885
MSSNGDDIRRTLDTLSREASPLREMSREALMAEADRRRRRRRLRIAGAATAMAVTVCGVGVFAAVVRKSPSPDRSAGAPVLGSVPSWGAQEPGLFTCGQPIGLPTAERFDGFALSPLTVERPVETSDGPPRVTTTLGPPSATGLDATEVYPTVLVLRDGVVVGGPVQAGALPPGRPLRSPDWRPSDQTIRQAAPTWLCGGVTWQQVWADPGRYTVALVMTPPTADGNRPVGRAIDASYPLLISMAKLDGLR